ncbi:hypothetical protein OQA88_8677 [Cercophora sp. LCS_1]
MRQSQRAAARAAAAQLRESSPASHSSSGAEAEAEEVPESSPSPPPTKRRKTTAKPTKSTPRTEGITAIIPPPPSTTLALPPLRAHPPSYHTALLLSPTHHNALLTWFTTVYNTRSMPWRKPFRHPSTIPQSDLAQRAYEVWISEIMLQQTRVAVVKDYYTRWMATFPTISALAEASEEKVMELWQGLGYYSRARRIHAAAKQTVDEDGGLLPVGRKKVPGVGRYTEGAIGAIVFGRAEAMVDGNVMRVLARQVGLRGDAKEKKVGDHLWGVAEGLVKAVAGDKEVGERPGLWGQALMELGSTVCGPKPGCGSCPVTASCRAYLEGWAVARGEKGGDIEDGCGLCEPFEVGEVKKGKGATSPYFGRGDAEMLDVAVDYASKFPLKKPKKKVREEETIVCAIRRVEDGAYLIHRRPDKGLLAGLWELPSYTLPATNDSTADFREEKAEEYVSSLMNGADKTGKGAEGKRKRPATKGMSMAAKLKSMGELDSVPWVFSHLKLTMHVHSFEVERSDVEACVGPRSRWACAEEIDRESMGTGMKKCWSLVKAQTPSLT